MRRMTEVLFLALASFVIMLLAMACRSGDTSSDLVSSDPLEVLSASGESFSRDVSSLQAELAFSVNVGGFVVNASSATAFQGPDQMHATMDLTGLGTYEMLLLGTELYMNMPGQGWVHMSLDDEGLAELGLNPADLEKLVTDHSMLDYRTLVQGLGGEVHDLGRETLDGGRFHHYRASLDFSDVVSAFSDAFGATGELGLSSVSGPLMFDVWVDTETGLPHKLTADGEFAFGATTMGFDATMRFFGYNEPVEIPGAPADAVPFASLTLP